MLSVKTIVKFSLVNSRVVVIQHSITKLGLLCVFQLSLLVFFQLGSTLIDTKLPILVTSDVLVTMEHVSRLHIM